MARIRTFLGIALSDEIRRAIESWHKTLREKLPHVQWVKPENWHITLIFLGDVSAEEVPAICRETQSACGKVAPFEVSVERLGCFPDIRRPRIVWAGVIQCADLIRQLHDLLGMQLETLGFRQEDRSFTPHITLGRGKGTLRGVKDVFFNQASHVVGSMPVEEVQIYSSELRPGGSVYQVMGRARLGQSIAASEVKVE